MITNNSSVSELTEKDVLSMAIGVLYTVMPLCEMKEDYLKNAKVIQNKKDFENTPGLVERCQKSIDYIKNILDELNLH